MDDKKREGKAYKAAIRRARNTFLALLDPSEKTQYLSTGEVDVTSKLGEVGRIRLREAGFIPGVSWRHCARSCAHIWDPELEYVDRPLVGFWDSATAIYLHIKHDLPIGYRQYGEGWYFYNPREIRNPRWR